MQKECEHLKERMHTEPRRNFQRAGAERGWGGGEGARKEGKGRSCCSLYTSLGTLEFIPEGARAFVRGGGSIRSQFIFLQDGP